MGDYVYLVHHGIRNQKWGHRRYQNEDGSLTTLGRIHYGVGQAKDRASTLGSYAKQQLKWKAENASRAIQRSPQYRAAKKSASDFAYKAKRTGTDALVDSQKALTKARRTANYGFQLAKAKTEQYGQRAKSEVGYYGRKTMNEVRRALNANSAEADRLRSYLKSNEYHRLMVASYANLANQTEYKMRKQAAKAFINERSRLGNITENASYRRYQDRRAMDADDYAERKEANLNWQNRKYQRRSEGRKNREAAIDTAYDWFDMYSGDVQNAGRRMSEVKKGVKSLWRHARGHKS